jgi:ribonuclease P protein component
MKALKTDAVSPRVAVVVSKKIFKSAVSRNRARRRIYAAIEELLMFEEPYDIIVRVHSNLINEVEFIEVQKQLMRLLTKVGVVRVHPAPVWTLGTSPRVT